MANDPIPVKPTTTPLERGTHSPTTATANPSSGKSLPVAGSTTPSGRARPADGSVKPPDLHALLAQLNEQSQKSGRPNYYKLDSSAGHSVIQEIDPDTSKVVSEIPASEFKALAQSLGVSGLLFDAHA